ncbi:MAG: M81 family metallopeptidase [Pseudomonadales bacterium]
MRIALAGISHETNTFCSGETTASDFSQVRGARMLRSRGQHTDLGGAIDACAALDIEVEPLLYAIAQPSGLVSAAAYEGFRDEIVAGLQQAAPLDGVVLLLHGAGVVAGTDDLEGDLVAAIRACVGDELPIAASFDLHGNVTQAMADGLNGVFACQQYPHIDLHKQSAAAVALVADMHQRGYRCRCSVQTLPLLLPTTTTFEGVGKRVLTDLQALAKGRDVVNLSWFHGFPYTDIPHVGSHLVVTGTNPEAARHLLADAADYLWQQREAFRVRSLSAAEAVAAATEQPAGPVVVHETSDNCGAGTPGDGTHLLRAMLDAQLGERACFGFIVDPEVARAAHAAGVGAQLDVQLGGKTDALHGAPIVASAYVRALHDGRLVMQHMNRGAPLKLGPLARLVIEDMDVVVASRRSQTFDTEPFLAVGIDISRYHYVALKSSNHFRAGFAHLAAAIVTADPPGLSTHRIDTFERVCASGPLWPIDEEASFP